MTSRGPVTGYAATGVPAARPSLSATSPLPDITVTAVAQSPKASSAVSARAPDPDRAPQPGLLASLVSAAAPPDIARGRQAGCQVSLVATITTARAGPEHGRHLLLVDSSVATSDVEGARNPTSEAFSAAATNTTAVQAAMAEDHVRDWCRRS